MPKFLFVGGPADRKVLQIDNVYHLFYVPEEVRPAVSDFTTGKVLSAAFKEHAYELCDIALFTELRLVYVSQELTEYERNKAIGEIIGTLFDSYIEIKS